MAIFGYTVLLVGVYKLLKIESELAKIKKLLEERAPLNLPASGPSAASAPEPAFAEPHGYDDATEYAAKLLRAVNAQSQPSVTPNYPVHPESR